MPSGNTYVPAPSNDNDYSNNRVRGYSVSTYDLTIPSGATTVLGIYYKWNDSGFTGKGWMYAVEGGPTNIYPSFSNDDDVANYVATKGNLDDVFSYWSQNYNLTGWNKFYMAVGAESGCMDVVNNNN